MVFDFRWLILFLGKILVEKIFEVLSIIWHFNPFAAEI
jgi:hypothetical protein